MEIVKTAIKVGNSAGVLLPRKWLNSQVRVILEPLNIEADILNILKEENILKDSLGIYLFGSYAKNEQTIDSDVDILVITNTLNKRFKNGKYELICVTRKEIERQLKENALPILPILKEAKAIINQEFIKDYLSSPLTEKNLKWHVETTKSIMKVVEEDIVFSKEIRQEVSDASAYSLVLRLRTLYIIDCIKKDKPCDKKNFLKLIKKVSGTLGAYERYLSVKNKDTSDCRLKIEEADKLLYYINKKIMELEKWLKEKKD